MKTDTTLVVGEKKKPKARGKPIVRARCGPAPSPVMKLRGRKPRWKSPLRIAQRRLKVGRAYSRRLRLAARVRDVKFIFVLSQLGWTIADVASRLGCDYWLVRSWYRRRDRWGGKVKCPAAVLSWLRRCVRSLDRVAVPFS